MRWAFMAFERPEGHQSNRKLHPTLFCWLFADAKSTQKVCQLFSFLFAQWTAKKFFRQSLLIFFPFRFTLVHDFFVRKNVTKNFFPLSIGRRSCEHQKRSNAVQQLDGDGLSVAPAVGVACADVAAIESDWSLVLDAESILLQWKSGQRSSSAPSDVRIEKNKISCKLKAQLKSLSDKFHL